MDKQSRNYVLFSILISLFIASAPTYAQQENCSTYSFSNNNNYARCINLPVLNSSLHWNYHQSNNSVDIAYRHTGVTVSNWVSWALNPTGRGMLGAQCLVALHNSSGNIHAYTSAIGNSYQTQLAQGPLSFGVPTIEAEFRNNNEMIIFASLQLPTGSTSFNQVWQVGPVNGDSPSAHPQASDNLRATGTVDFSTGQISGNNSGEASPPPETNQQICSTYSFSNNNNYARCTSLSVLNSFLHWNYHQSNNSVDIAYRHTGVTASNWVSWALNPTGQGMLGAQCLVALHNSSGNVHAYTSAIGNSYQTQLAQGPLSFGVPTIEAEFRNNNEMIIFASLQLPTGSTSFNQVWQVGPVNGGTPGVHPQASDNLRATGTVDFATGQTSGNGGGEASRQRKRNVHGVLNVVSWGILMPLGAVIARYLKVFKSAGPAWFYLHVACQTSAYIVGVAGWGTGIKLGADSAGITQDTHRRIGITMFCLGTIQVFALLLRPKPDHKYRFHWNIYHYVIGYTVIILSIVNIFEGFDILNPDKKWKNAYIGVIIAIGAVAAVLEAFTWFIVLKRKREGGSSDKYPYNSNGVNGINGYGAGQQQGV